MAEGDLRTSLGAVYGNMGDYEQAVQQFTAAHHIFAELALNDRLPYVEEYLRLAQNLLTKVQ